MSSSLLGLTKAAALVVMVVFARPCDSQNVKVVNVIPKKYSGEVGNNAEPSLAISPTDASVVAVTVHLPGNDICVHPKLSGIFVSSSAGDNWKIACALKQQTPSYPGDLTTRFSGDGAWLYVSHLRPNGLHLVGSTTVPALSSVSNLLSAALGTLTQMDQPQVRTRPGPGTTELAVAVIDHDFTSGACSFARFLWSSQTTVPTNFSSDCLDVRSQESPWAIRLAMHADGTAYVVFLRAETANDGTTRGDVVVVRGKPSASGGTLGDLREGGSAECSRDNKLGVRVVCGVPLPWDPEFGPGVNADFGWEVRRGSLSIAVDPNDSQKVYVAWGDESEAGALLTLRVRRSTDGGQTWLPDIYKVKNATNPALAVDAKGRLAFLYQLFVAGASPRWETHLAWTTEQQKPISDIVLADTPAGPAEAPLAVDDPPYQGDFLDLVSVGNEFLGVFSARNDPGEAIFPFGVKYNRLCAGGSLQAAKGKKSVAPSIDPFFFRVQPDRASNAVAPGTTGLNC